MRGRRGRAATSFVTGGEERVVAAAPHAERRLREAGGVAEGGVAGLDRRAEQGRAAQEVRARLDQPEEAVAPERPAPSGHVRAVEAALLHPARHVLEQHALGVALPAVRPVVGRCEHERRRTAPDGRRQEAAEPERLQVVRARRRAVQHEADRQPGAVPVTLRHGGEEVDRPAQ
jgi:hypothetical protein